MSTIRYEGSDKNMGTTAYHRKIYTVAIPREYFPRETYQPFTYIHDKVRVLATSRREAADLAWTKHKARWVAEFRPGIISVSLYVNDPTSPTQNTLTRLSPVKVS